MSLVFTASTWVWVAKTSSGSLLGFGRTGATLIRSGDQSTDTAILHGLVATSAVSAPIALKRIARVKSSVVRRRVGIDHAGRRVLFQQRCGPCPWRKFPPSSLSRFHRRSARILLPGIDRRYPLRMRRLSRGHCQSVPARRMNKVWAPRHDGLLGWSFRQGQPTTFILLVVINPQCRLLR